MLIIKPLRKNTILINITFKFTIMKKLAFLTLLICATNISVAQERKQNNLSVEQQTELRLKQMTLDLDLNENQQKELKILLNKEAEKKEAFKAQKEKGELSKDEKFALKSKALDQKIEFKNSLKKILTPEQMKKWEENAEKRKEMALKKRHSFKGAKRDRE